MSEDISQYISQLDKLPLIEDAVTLPKNKFNDLAKLFIKSASYCDSGLLPDKAIDWCSYLKCEGGTCKYKFDVTGSATLPVTRMQFAQSTPDYCFDLWHCPPPWFCEINYYFLGIMCFCLCLITLIMNIIYLPSFTFYGHRHGTDVLFTSLAMSDIFVFLLFTYLHCLPYIYRSHASQIIIYSRLVARTVPFFAPLLNFFKSMSSWLLCCILFERYLYQQHGKHAQRIFSTKVSIGIVIVLAFVLLVFTTAKFFEFTSVSSGLNSYSVHLTETGKGKAYHDVVTHFLKVPLEYFGPLLGYVVVLGMMYTSFGEQGFNSFQSTTEKKNRELVKDFIIINEADRESRMLLSVVVLSTFAMFSTFFDFLYHVLTTEPSTVTNDNLNYLRFSCQIMFVVFMFSKPFFYAYISPPYCRGMRRYFVASLPIHDDGEPSSAMTFEQTIANQMRQSISYRNSVWSSNIKDPETIFKLGDSV